MARVAAAVTAEPEEVLAVVGNPFRGLEPYYESDKRHLFARDSDVDLIQSRIWSSRVTVLFAGSGVGKTSFLNAKLLPTLRSTFGDGNIAMPLRWAITNPAAEIGRARAQVDVGTRTRQGSLIVLDQFEEIFQHLSDPQLLRDAGQQLADIVDDVDANVRLLISVREEFLADLTLFDVFVPGVLTNYYRLSRLTPKQARLIIEKTASMGGRKTDSKGVVDLIRDLSAVRDAKQSNGGLFVDPPYLQIVCRRIWTRESPLLFLSSYKKGTAKVELEAYCDSQLKSFSRPQRTILRKAIQQLTGPHEAKKPARVDELAAEIGARPADVTAVLETLSRDDVRILRQWPNKQVYELYHDMYAPMLWKWKTSQEQKEWRRKIVNMALIAAAVSWMILWPFYSWAKASVFLSRPDVTLDASRDLSAVVEMRDAFRRTLLFTRLGDSLWRTYMHRLASLSALLQDTDAAMAYRLADLATETTLTPDKLDAVLGPAASLQGTVNGLVAVTDAAIDGSDIVIGTSNGTLWRWTQSSHKPSEIPITVPGPTWVSPARAQSTGVGSSQPKVLCLSANGERALVAWLSNQVPFVGVIETVRGTLINESPTQQLQEALAPNAPGVITLQDVRGAMSPNGSRFAIVQPGGATVFDRRGRWSVPASRLPDDRPVAAAFVTDEVLALVTQRKTGSANPFTSRDRLTLWAIGADQALSWGAQNLELPPGMAPVTDGAGGIVALVDGRWEDVTATGRRGISVPTPIDGPALPRAYDVKTGVLLSQDIAFRLIVSYPQSTQPQRFTRIVASGQRSFPIPAQRSVTPAGSALLSKHLVVTVDDTGTAVRIWSLPKDTTAATAASAATPTSARLTPAAPVAPADDASPSWHSVDRQWVASTEGNRVFVARTPGGPHEHTWTAADPIRNPRRIFVSTTGRRVVVSLDDGMWYGGEASTELVNVMKGRGDVVFGPGPDRVTILTPRQLHIKQAPSSEGWTARVQDGSFLVHAPDEEGVVLYSGFWIHRFTTPRGFGSLGGFGHWPQLISSLRPEPIVRVQPDFSNAARLVINDGADAVDFTAEQQRFSSWRSGWMSLATLWTPHLDLCEGDAPQSATMAYLGTRCGWTQIRSARPLGSPLSQ